MIRPRKYKKAFTIMEMLLSLAIMAMLLAAIAAAVHASLMSYKENDELAAAMQTVRTVLNRLTREVRTADDVVATYSSLTLLPPDPAVDEIHYEYTGGQLIYRVTKSGTPISHVLISNSDDVQIIGFAVEREAGLDWQGFDCTKSITVRIVVQIEGKSFGMTASAAPRRNQTY